MTRLLVDTSYLVGHFNPRDAHHDAAQDIQDRFMAGDWDELLLLDSVFAETLTVLAARTSYNRAKQVGEALRTGAEIHWVGMSDHIDDLWHEYLVQPGGQLSIVDCALIAVADAYGIKEIATFDKGFDGIDRLKRVP